MSGPIDPIGFLRHRIENGMPLYQGDVDAALAVARAEGRLEAVRQIREQAKGRMRGHAAVLLSNFLGRVEASDV